MDPVYPVIFVDAIVVKIRDGQARNTPFYVVMGVTMNGERGILGTWAGDDVENARFWLQIFSELKNRGIVEVMIVVYDGLRGLPETINTIWGYTVMQRYVIHLIRNSFRYVGRQHRDVIVESLKPVYTAPPEQAAEDRFAELVTERGGRCPVIMQLWHNAWTQYRTVPDLRREDPESGLHG